MNAVTRSRPGHWADHPTGLDAKFVDADDSRSGQWNAPMAAAAIVAVLLPLLMVGIGALAVFLIRT